MIKSLTIKKQALKFIRKTLAVVLAGVFLFTDVFGWAKEEELFSANNSKLAPSSRLDSEDFKTSFAADAICKLIEIRARYGKPLTEITLNDIEKWKNSTDTELDNCIFNLRPEEGEVIIEIPAEGLAVRYFDPAIASVITPYPDISKLETKIIGPD